mmetsp:Transcript_21883/g.37720  ORF Transcript_21883/g.37720 Transcript_21883/m.37720 type:complete len:252 (-) Transcript_21883:127-882(-)
MADVEVERVEEEVLVEDEDGEHEAEEYDEEMIEPPVYETAEEEAEALDRALQSQATEFDRSKTSKQGPFLASYSIGTPEGVTFKMRRSKTGKYLLQITVPRRVNGELELSIMNTEELDRMESLAVAIDVTTLDQFRIRKIAEGALVRNITGEDRKTMQREKSRMRRTKSSKVKGVVFEFFVSARKNYGRYVDSQTIPKLPPIAFDVPKKCFEGNTGLGTTYLVEWVVSDAVIRKRNNSKRLQFLYPPIPSY